MELKVNIDLEAAVAQALAPEKLQPILDKHLTDAITSAVRDATGYDSEFRKALEVQLADAMPHGLKVTDVAKFQHVLNEALREAVHGQNAAAVNVALAEAAASVMPDLPASVKLSQLMEDARDGLHVQGGAEFFAHLEESSYGHKHLSLDSETRKLRGYGNERTGRFDADYQLAFTSEGECYSLKLNGKQITPTSLPNAISGFQATLLALYVGRTRIEFDMDPDDVASAAAEQYDD
ncbi:hypothetical protein D3C86_751330 [compost metagenome]